MQTHGSAVWHGGIKDGKGAISTKSGALKQRLLVGFVPEGAVAVELKFVS
jgi:hypothetical protein